MVQAAKRSAKIELKVCYFQPCEVGLSGYIFWSDCVWKIKKIKKCQLGEKFFVFWIKFNFFCKKVQLISGDVPEKFPRSARAGGALRHTVPLRRAHPPHLVSTLHIGLAQRVQHATEARILKRINTKLCMISNQMVIWMVIFLACSFTFWYFCTYSTFWYFFVIWYDSSIINALLPLRSHYASQLVLHHIVYVPSKAGHPRHFLRRGTSKPTRRQHASHLTGAWLVWVNFSYFSTRHCFEQMCCKMSFKGANT